MPTTAEILQFLVESKKRYEEDRQRLLERLQAEGVPNPRLMVRLHEQAPFLYGLLEGLRRIGSAYEATRIPDFIQRLGETAGQTAFMTPLPERATTGSPTADVVADVLGQIGGTVAQIAAAEALAGPAVAALGRMPQLARAAEAVPGVLRTAGRGAATGAALTGIQAALAPAEQRPGLRQLAENIAFMSGANVGGALARQGIAALRPGLGYAQIGSRVLFPWEAPISGAAAGLAGTAAAYPFGEHEDALREAGVNAATMAIMDTLFGALRAYPPQAELLQSFRKAGEALQRVRQAVAERSPLRQRAAEVDFWTAVNEAYHNARKIDATLPSRLPEEARARFRALWEQATAAPEPRNVTPPRPQPETAPSLPAPEQAAPVAPGTAPAAQPQPPAATAPARARPEPPRTEPAPAPSVTPRVGGRYTARASKSGAAFTGTVERIYRARTGAVLAVLRLDDGSTRTIPVSKYAEWRPAPEPQAPAVPEQVHEQPAASTQAPLTPAQPPPGTEAVAAAQPAAPDTETLLREAYGRAERVPGVVPIWEMYEQIKDRMTPEQFKEALSDRIARHQETGWWMSPHDKPSTLTPEQRALAIATQAEQPGRRYLTFVHFEPPAGKAEGSFAAPQEAAAPSTPAPTQPTHAAEGQPPAQEWPGAPPTETPAAARIATAGRMRVSSPFAIEGLGGQFVVTETGHLYPWADGNLTGSPLALFREGRWWTYHDRDKPLEQVPLGRAIPQLNAALREVWPDLAPPTEESQRPTRTEASPKGPAEDDQAGGLPIAVSPDDVDYERALAAFRWNSMEPEARARQVQQEYVQHMRAIWERLRPLAQTPEQQAILREELQRYRGRYLVHLNAWLAARSRTASVMVTGASKFPTARNQKALETEHRRLDEWRQFTERAARAIERRLVDARSLQQREDAEFERLRKVIDENLASIRAIDTGQSAFDRAAFKQGIEGVIRRSLARGNIEAVRRAVEYLRAQQATMPKPVFTEGHSIWRAVEAAAQRAATPLGSESVAAQGAKAGGLTVEVLANPERNGVEIRFSQKPSGDILQILHQAGFRWLPRQGLWYAKRSEKTLEAAREVQRRLGVQREPAPPRVEDSKEQPLIRPAVREPARLEAQATAKAAAEAAVPSRVTKAQRRAQESVETAIGPRRVGGRYLDGLSHQEYEVLDIQRGSGPRGFEITVRWSDGRVATHSTPWDPKQDRVIYQPPEESGKPGAQREAEAASSAAPVREPRPEAAPARPPEAPVETPVAPAEREATQQPAASSGRDAMASQIEAMMPDAASSIPETLRLFRSVAEAASAGKLPAVLRSIMNDWVWGVGGGRVPDDALDAWFALPKREKARVIADAAVELPPGTAMRNSVQWFARRVRGERGADMEAQTLAALRDPATRDELVAEILEGYKDREEILDDIETMRQTGNLRYTARGMAYGARALEEALRLWERPAQEAAPQQALQPETGEPSRTTPFDTPAVVAARAEQAAMPSTHLIDTPERQALRERIRDELYGIGATRKEGIAYIVMGPPASGKSGAVAAPIARRIGALMIDADAAKERLPEHAGGRNAGLVHKESSDIAHAVFETALQNGDNIVFPVVGRRLEKVRRLREALIRNGYQAYLVLVDVSPQKAAERAVRRFEETNRFVDPAYILYDVGTRPRENFAILKAEGGWAGYAVYSNEVPKGEPPRVLEASSPDEAAAWVQVTRRVPGRLLGGRPDQSRREGGSEARAGGQPEGAAVGPAPSPVAPSPQPLRLPELAYGREGTARTERGTAVQTRYALVEASSLLASHRMTEGGVVANPAYPTELQPRERTRMASEMQVRRLARDLEPELLGESALASQGAPIVGPDLVVESGNGRVMAIQWAYRTGQPKAEEYRNWLRFNAGRFGLTSEQVDQLREPVLVRVRASDVERVRFVQEANEQPVAAMSATEQAMADARRLTPELLARFVPNEDAEIVTAANRAFINAFMEQVVGPNEQGRYITAEGVLSQDGVNRIRNVLFARAYGDPTALARLAESTDDNIRNVSQAALMAAPRFAILKARAERGELYPLDPTGDIAQAMNKLSELRESGQTVETYLQQQALFDDGLSPTAKDLLALFDRYKRSRKALVRLLDAYANAWEAAGDPRQAQMWGSRPPTVASTLEVATRKVDREYGGRLDAQASLFAAGPASGPGAGGQARTLGAPEEVPGYAETAGSGAESRAAPGEAGQRLAAVEQDLKTAAEQASEARRQQGGVTMGAGLGIPPLSRPAPGRAKSPYAFKDAEIEARFEAARGVPTSGPRERATNWVAQLAAYFTREFQHLPRTAQYAPIRYALLSLIKQPRIVSDRAIRMINGVTADLNADSYDLFRRKVILDDLSHDADAGMLLPFGFTPETLAKEKGRIGQAALRDKAVSEAIGRRNRMWAAVKEAYIEAMEAIGFNVRDRLSREDYFRHQVLEYAATQRLSGAGQRIRTPAGRGFLKQRKGTSYDINSEYLQAEYEVLRQMLLDIEIARVIRLVKDRYDIRPELQRQATRANLEELARVLEGERREQPQQTVMTPGGGTREVPIASGKLEEALKGFRQRIAIAMSKLRKLAEEGALWRGERGEWQDVVEELEQQQYDYEAWLEAADGEGESPWPTKLPSTPMEEASRRFWQYLSALYKAEGQPGQVEAASIFKALANRRAWIRETLGDRYKTWRDFVPDTHTIWQPMPGNRLFLGQSIPEQLAAKLLEDQLEELGITKEDLRQVLILGGPRDQYVIPSELANQLDNLTNRPANSLIEQSLRALTGIWKIRVLMVPSRVVRYNLRNLSGDADHVFVGNPSAFRKLPQAAKEIMDVVVRGKEPTGEFYEWYRRGGMQGLLAVQELQDLTELPAFQRFAEAAEKNLPAKVLQGLKAYWKAARIGTDAREAWLRYAAYLDYLEQIRRNGAKPDNYGASIPEEIDALGDSRDKAFVLSNQLLGAYDQVSVGGQELRRLLWPFWSWVEVNARWYVQAFRNAARGRKLAATIGRAAARGASKSPLLLYRLGKFVLKATAFASLLAVYNNLFWPDEEKDLPEDVRRRPHVVLGRDPDGKVRYFSNLGALTDFLEWFGLDEVPSDVADWATGRRSLGDMAREASTDWLNKLAQGVTPLIKLPFELAFRRQAYPDIREPRRIRDPWLYLARQLGVEPLYRSAKGLPFRPTYGLQDWFLYRVDPDEAAYWDIIDRKEDFARRIGKSTGGYSDSPRANALYWLKLALRYGDRPAAQRFLMEYAALGGTRQGLKQSLRTMDPLYGLSQAEQQAFIRQLTPDEQERLEHAYRFYQAVLTGVRALSQPPIPR